MSDSNRVALGFIEEVTLGTTPASALQEIRKTGESMAFAIGNITSNEIRSDRQIPDLVQVGAESQGGFNFELSYGTYDELFEGALWDNWGSALTITDTDISASSSGGTSTFAAVGADFPSFAAGQWVEVRGFTESANNGYFQLLSATSSTLTLVEDLLTTEAAGDSVTIKGTMLANGVTRKSYTLEKHFQDLTTPQFLSFKGMVVNTLSLQVEAGAIFTGSFNFLGKTAVRGTATAGSGAYSAATTSQVMNAVGHIGLIRENDTALSANLAVQSLSLEISNNVRGDTAIGVLGFSNLSGGRVNVNGSMVVYFHEDAAAIYDRYLNGTASSFSFKAEDGAGNAYIVTMPQIKFSSADVLAGGADQSTVMNLGFQAILDPTFSRTIQIDRFAA